MAFLKFSNEFPKTGVYKLYHQLSSAFSNAYRVATRVLVSEPCSTIIVLYLKRSDPLFLITAALYLYGGKLVRHVHVHLEPL